MDSRIAADSYLSASQTVTIGTTSQFEEIAGTNWLSTVQDRFTTSTAGVVTYNGERDVELKISGFVTVSKSGGGADELEIRFAKNWVALDAGLVQSGGTTEAAAPTSVPLEALIDITTGDTIRMIVANNGSTANVVVDKASFVIVGA